VIALWSADLIMELRRAIPMLAVLVLTGGVVAWLLVPPSAPPVSAPPPPQVVIAGTLLGLEGDPVANALDLVRRYARAELRLELPDGSTRAVRPAQLGAEIDRARLAEFVHAAVTADSTLGRAHQRQREQDPKAVIQVPVPIRIDTAKAMPVLLEIKDGVDQPATDAFVDLAKRELRPEKPGFRLDVYGTLAGIDAALQRGESSVAVAVQRIEPRVLAAQLGNVQFDHVIGYFETRYSKSARYRARTYNLRLAASRLDGTVLLPGETFDFNATVGPRDEANGYRVAPVIAQGELVDGIGGGTCQISGTLHGAAFFAGLEVMGRVPHSRPSSYIKLGLDAAVAYPTINFRLRNPFSVPVVLHETVKGGVVRAEVLGPKRKRTVTFFRRIDDVTPFAEEERETERLPKGERVLTQRGIPGFKTTVFRIVRDGAYATRTKSVTEYPPTTQIVRIGMGPKSAKGKVKEDRGLEYVADKYLVLTQGPNIRTPGVKGEQPGGGTVESRTLGRTGRRGWQQKAGMKVFEADEDDDEG
jgi:vancomycin resistance protein YoaR